RALALSPRGRSSVRRPDAPPGKTCARILAFSARLPIESREGQAMSPLVGIIVGSRSDWETMKHAEQTLEALGVPCERRGGSPPGPPDLLFAYAGTAESRGLEVLIAGAGGAAHLPGMASAKTLLPVLGVPVESRALHGVDSLLSIVQMPAGVPV